MKWANEDDIGTIFGKDKHAMKKKVKKKGVIALESWIYLAEELIKVLEDREQHKIDAWFIRANTKIKKYRYPCNVTRRMKFKYHILKTILKFTL